MPTEAPRGEPVVLAPGTLKRIHVNGPRIRGYRTTGLDAPCWIVKHQGKTYHGRAVTLSGAIGTQSLPEGMPGCRHAKVWLETHDRVVIHAEEMHDDTCPA